MPIMNRLLVVMAMFWAACPVFAGQGGKKGQGGSWAKGGKGGGQGGGSCGKGGKKGSPAMLQLLAHLLMQHSNVATWSSSLPPIALETMLDAMVQLGGNAGGNGSAEEEYWWDGSADVCEAETETDTGMAQRDEDNWGPWVPQEPLIPEPQALCAIVVQFKARFCKNQ